MVKLEETYGHLDYFINIYDNGIRIQQKDDDSFDEIFIPMSIFNKIVEQLLVSGFENKGE